MDYVRVHGNCIDVASFCDLSHVSMNPINFDIHFHQIVQLNWNSRFTCFLQYFGKIRESLHTLGLIYLDI